MSRTQDETSRLPLGVVINEGGLVVIPSNRRPDGSLRKERRIRTGFKPQNEQAAYRTPRQRVRSYGRYTDVTGRIPMVGNVEKLESYTNANVFEW